MTHTHTSDFHKELAPDINYVLVHRAGVPHAACSNNAHTQAIESMASRNSQVPTEDTCHNMDDTPR